MNKPEAIINEIINGQWLMSHQGLMEFRSIMESLKNGQPQSYEENRKDNMLAFYNEDLKRLYPRDASEVPEGSIAVIYCVGVLMKYGSWYTWGADEIVYQLDYANNMQNVIATILVVDGPGGSVSALPPFMEFAKRKKKPVIGWCDTSLSLHRAIPDVVCDVQMAQNDFCAKFGSIGVVASWRDFTKYYEDLGVKDHEVYADESEHKSEIHRLLKEDEAKGKQLMKDRDLSPMAVKFQNIVKAAHPNLIEEEGVLTGRVFGADDAIRLNMINSKGSLQDAMLAAKGLAEVYQSRSF